MGVSDFFVGSVSSSLCFRRASIQGVRTRILVKSLYTPSVWHAVVVCNAHIAPGEIPATKSTHFLSSNLRRALIERADVMTLHSSGGHNNCVDLDLETAVAVAESLRGEGKPYDSQNG